MAERQKRNHKDRDSRNSQESNYESNFSTEVETMEMRRNSLNEEISVNASPDTDSFNWDEYENGGIAVSNKSEMDVLYSATIKNPEEKVVIMGTVVAITDKDVVLDIGFKSDGLVSIAEFKYRGIPEIGEEVEIIVESKEDKNGQILISHKKAQAEKSWNEVVKALEEDRIVQGYIKDRTKGGMIVDLMGLEAFLPGSQLDIKPIKDYDDYVGKTMDLKIVKINPILNVHSIRSGN